MEMLSARGDFSKKERLNAMPNHGEVLLGYQLTAPFDDGIDKEGLTAHESGAMLLYRLNSLEKHQYLLRLSRKGNKPASPALLVPVYLSRHAIDVYNPDWTKWVIRTFRPEFAEVFEKKHWWSEPTLVAKDHLQLSPDISSYAIPESSVPKQILEYWENLENKAVTRAELKKLLGLSAETKTA